MTAIYEWFEKKTIRKNLKYKLKKTDIPKLQKEDQFLIHNLMDGKYGVKIFLTTTKYCYDIAKNLKQDVYMVDMQDANFNLMSQFQSHLNIPLHYDLNEIFTKHVFIFVFNLPKSLYLKEFLRSLHNESISMKKYTLIYCTDLESNVQFLSHHFQLLG